MNENTTKLLEQLANKLGTTSEYLWGVLLRQAGVSATISLIYLSIVAIGGIGMWKLHKRFMKKDSPEDRYSECVYDKFEYVGIIMVIGLVIYGIASLIALAQIGNIINGYFSPEFWALDHILDSIN